MILGSEHEQYVIDMLAGLSKRVVITIHSAHWKSGVTRSTQDLVDYTMSLSPTKISRALRKMPSMSWNDPTLVIRDEDGKSFGVQFIGSPTGLEYRTFLQAIVASTHPQPVFSEGTVVKDIRQPVEAKIFVLPT